jgi:hypothetical protein
MKALMFPEAPQEKKGPSKFSTLRHDNERVKTFIF